MKDHQKRELVSRITKVAKQHAGSQQLRQRIASELLPALKQQQNREARLMKYIDAVHGKGPIVHCYDGTCPDPSQPDSRDSECPACRLLISIESQ